jgi:hypothetical protein
MRGAGSAVGKRSAAVATTILCALIAAGSAAAALIDYTAAPTPHNIVEVRAYRNALRLPPLLVQACSRHIPRDPPGKYGEDHMAALLGKVELLRMLDAKGGTLLVNNFLERSTDAEYILDDYRFCLGRIAPGWDKGAFGLPGVQTDTAAGWDEVTADLGGIPGLLGTPGTAGIPGCRDDEEGDWDMSMAYLIRIWPLARDAVRRRLGILSFQRLEQRVADAAWLQGGPSHADEFPCSVIPESENHQLTIEATRLLHNEFIANGLLPPADVAAGGDTIEQYDPNSDFDNDTNGLNARLHGWFEGWATHDFLEYNARSYSRLQLLGLLNVYDFSSDAKLRRAAGVVLDFLAAKAAAESMNLNRTAPFRRRAENQNNSLLGSDQVAAAMQVWVGNMAPTAELESFGIVHTMAIAASTRYRPPDVLTDLMLDPRHHDYLQQFNGMGQGELAFGTRDFTLSGGGVPTRCPYPDPFVRLEQGLVYLSATVVTPATPIPGLSLVFGSGAADECKGSGNDQGTVQRIVLMPRRPPRVHSADIPTWDDVIHSDENSLSACIGPGIACAQTFVVGGPQPQARCRVERDLPDGDHTTALRYDRECVGPEFDGLCYFVFIRTLQTRTQPFSYLVTHLCEPRSAQPEREALFDRFVQYLTEGDGQPTRPTFCDPADRAPIPFSVPDECTYTIEVTPPEQYGPIRPGQRVQLINEFDWLYFLEPLEMWSQPRSAIGPVARISAGIPRLRVANPGADEWLVEPASGVSAPIDASATTRTFTWRVVINSLGSVSGQITSAEHPEALRRITVSVLDETKLQQDCTVTLPNGKKGCYRPGVLCGDPPVPCATGAVQPIQLPGAFFPYGGAPLNSPQPQPILFGGSIGPTDPSHTYIVTVCAYWWRFMTAEEYRTDPAGESNPDAHESCPQDEPARCLNPLICAGEFNPLSPHFPDIVEKRRGRFP